MAYYFAYFFGGVFLFNSIPHVVSGMMGRPFQSPFAKPSGVGLSSSTVNVLWGAFNLAAAYSLICQIGIFDPRNVIHVLVSGLGGLLISVFSAWNFGRFNGGNSPESIPKP